MTPAAQAVMEAATSNTIIQADPVYRQCIAAAIEALADVVIPDDPSPEAQQDVDQIERTILAITAELRGQFTSQEV